MATGNYKYRGVQIDQAAPTFKLSTKDVRTYLQDRVDLIVASLRKKDEKFGNLPNITVDVIGTQASKYFVPFMVALPPEVLMDQVESETNETPSIFFCRDEESHLYMIKEIKDFFRLYIFTKKDKKRFRDQKFLNELGISSKVGARLASFCEPKYRQTYDRNNGDGDEKSTDMVVFYIDPIRIFHEMVCQENEDPSTYEIKISDVVKIRDGEYKYSIKKIRNNHKSKNYKKSFYRELDGFLRRAR